MIKSPFKRHVTLLTSTALLSSMMALPAVAQTNEEDDDGVKVVNVEEITTIGSRRKGRSAGDTPAPIDVISVGEFRQSSASDVQDLLRTSVPSFNINAQPISDAASIVRPANLRGLSPDNTLVLVNGKRRHRGSVISFLGGGISDGAQGVDISALPSIALKRVEVLRDGASSQYGSDAIAGVINFVLKDNAEGGTVEATYGSTYAGDGDNYRISANLGLPIGDTGFVSLSAEYGDTDGTVRSVVRDDVLALIAAGNTDAADFETINSYTDEVPQYWGQPDVEDDLKVFVNSAITLSESAEVYAFGSYAERTVTGGFFYRNPTNRGGVYRGPNVDPLTGALDPDGVASVRVGDLDGVGVGEACPAGIPLTGNAGLIPDPTVLAAVTASANCFSFIETIPGGFVPRFGGDNEDYSIAGGLRGQLEFGAGLDYDLSITHGANRTDFFINNTVNASLGPDTPRNFIPGGQKQTETAINADFVYALPSDFASDINIAFGGEYREETFDLFAGDAASFALGPLADQGFSSSSNGFGGFPNSSSNSQDSYAGYVDIEFDLTEDLTVQGALRYEDYSAFGDTLNYKLAALYNADDHLRIRATYSTGFHAPTAGQANITNVTTQNVNGVLVDQGTLPLSSAAGQLAADFIEAQGNGRPQLGTEEARNISVGFAFDWGAATWTVDFFDIDVDDRVALGANVNFLDALNAVSGTSFDSVGAALTGLDAAGTINRQDFIGLDDLSQFRFFSNSFSTNTRGIDVVGRYGFDLGDGVSNLTLAANYTRTKVTDRGTLNPINDGRVAALEDLLPNIKGSLTWTHAQGPFSTLLRVNYYGGWDDTGNGVNGIGSEFLFDAQVTYEVREGLSIVGGVDNILSNHSDRNPFAGSLGQLYPEAGPFGFNGGQYYLRVRAQF
ncbi:TonB-dependent receptor plug domain-containing protein [Kordiimonas aquimaris]|uniref:TonB-dependent receptor plug domain-containing protein n=1 Tax=Kordiimonas aquimaris TaxID=707591 RepID=UPI0021D088E6|nr:TonB-dependent receptor [Kordiimonas aquimaris]